MSQDNDTSYPCVQFMLTRRTFLKGATVSVALAPLLASCEFAEVFDSEIVAAIDFNINEDAYKKLQDIGGIACADAGAVSLILIRDKDDSVLAFDRKCPHNDLSMGPCEGGDTFESGTWLEKERQLVCNWHGSVFDETGERVSGPTPRGINRYAVEFDAATGAGKVQVV